jgi:hypothetical protein
MFGTELDTGPSFLLFFGQQLGALLIPLLWLLLTARVTDSLAHALGHPLGNIANVVWYVTFVWGIGLPIGYLITYFFPSAAAMGRWVWLLPSLGFCGCFIYDVVVYGFPATLSDFFSSETGEDIWVVAIVTYPTFCAIAYSAGVILVRRRWRYERTIPE